MRLYKMEFFKLFCRKLFLTSLLSVLGIFILYFYFVNVGEERCTVNGKVYTGYEAIQMDRMITEEFKGTMTDDIAEKIIEKYGFPSKVEEYYGKFRDENYLTGFVTEYLGDGYFRDWDDYKISTSLYPISQSILGEVIEKSGKDIPLSYVKGWTVFFDMLQFGMVLGSILLLIGVSPIFAEERQKKMSALLLTSEEGRNGDIVAKILAAFTMASIIYSIIVISVFLMVGVIYGVEGMDCMIGIVLENTLNPARAVTMKPVSQFLALTLLLDYLALASLCAIVLCVSAYFETTFHAVTVSGIVWGTPLLIRIIFGGTGYIFMSGTPMFLIMKGIVLDWYHTIFFPIFIAVCICIICVISGWRTYKTLEVSG